MIMKRCEHNEKIDHRYANDRIVLFVTILVTVVSSCICTCLIQKTGTCISSSDDYL